MNKVVRPKAKWIARGVGAAACFWVAPITAYEDGIIADHCVHCHEAPLLAELTFTSEAGELMPGEPAAFVVELRGEGLLAGGISVQYDGPGELVAPDTNELRLLRGQLTHRAPLPAEDGLVTFRFGYLPSETPEDVRFRVTALAANGDGTALGDTAAEGLYGFVFGCESEVFYVDGDGDAYGSASDGSLVACVDSAPAGYVSVDGDCNDYNSGSHPGAQESCNGFDDDCNEEVDDAPQGESLCAGGHVCRAGQCAPSNEPAQGRGCSVASGGPASPWMIAGLSAWPLLAWRRRARPR